MVVATLKENVTEVTNIPGLAIVRLTTTATTCTWTCPYFSTIVAAIGNNESDNDGVSVAVDGTKITIKVTTLGDIVTLQVAGRA